MIPLASDIIIHMAAETYLCISTDNIASPSFGYPVALLFDGALSHDSRYKHDIVKGQRVTVF